VQLVAPLFYVFGTEKGVDIKDAEADTFFCFANLMGEVWLPVASRSCNRGAAFEILITLVFVGSGCVYSSDGRCERGDSWNYGEVQPPASTSGTRGAQTCNLIDCLVLQRDFASATRFGTIWIRCKLSQSTTAFDGSRRC
jgi:hypothetical protein